MQSFDITNIIGLLLGGSALGAILVYLINRRKQQQSEFVALIEEYKDMLKELKVEHKTMETKFDEALERHSKQIKKLEREVEEKEREIIQLRNQLIIFESSHSDVPVPMWLKDTSGKMLFLNKEYEEKILHPLNKTAEDYLHKYDIDIWPIDVAKMFTNHDKLVMKSKRSVEAIECWVGTDGVEIEGRVLKYPRFANRNTVIGIGGIVIEMWVKGKRPTRMGT
jgi:hypothetical protein